MALPSPAAKGGVRGKTFGKQLGPPPGNPSTNDEERKVNIKGSATTSIGKNLQNLQKVSIIEKNNKPKKREIHRQAELFSSLDQAENLALELLSLASSTAKVLADGTDTTTKLKSWMEKGSNGKEYLEKISKIHQLLSPHSHLVVAYRNHAVDTDTTNTTDSSISVKKANTNDSITVSKNNNETKEAKSIPLKNKNNMYAARVELRLALERRDVLQESLKLERETYLSTSDSDDDCIKSVSKKRKIDE